MDELVRVRVQLEAVEREKAVLEEIIAQQRELIPYVEPAGEGSPDKVSRALAAQDQIARALGTASEPNHDQAAQLIEAMAGALHEMPHSVDPEVTHRATLVGTRSVSVRVRCSSVSSRTCTQQNR